MDRKDRNKQLLFQALIDLMEVKPVSRISVSELTERANVNRTSFYNFYTGIDDMIQKIEADLSKSLAEAFREYALEVANHDSGNHDSATKLFSFLFRFVKDNAKIFGFLLTPDTNHIVLQKTCNLLAEYVATESPEQQYSLPFITFGCIGVIQRWLQGGMKENPEDMALLAVAWIEKGTGHLKSALPPAAGGV
jgi:hypothetical protein